MSRSRPLVNSPVNSGIPLRSNSNPATRMAAPAVGPLANGSTHVHRSPNYTWHSPSRCVDPCAKIFRFVIHHIRVHTTPPKWFANGVPSGFPSEQLVSNSSGNEHQKIHPWNRTRFQRSLGIWTKFRHCPQGYFSVAKPSLSFNREQKDVPPKVV